MAKLTAPLMSFTAAGQLAQSLVYFGWKGLNVVRKYVIPTNPKTTKQITQRGYLSDAVDEVHTLQADATHPLGAADTAAYSLWGGVFPTPRTWFNQAVKNVVDVVVAGNTPALFGSGALDNSTPGQLDVEVYTDEASLANGKFFYGTSKTALINSEDAVIADKKCSATISSLTAGTKYFVQFRADTGDDCEGAQSGIYSEYAT